MGYTNRFNKQGCASAKDVDFSRIASNAKVDVPAMVISSFQKKVSGAKKPFDVSLDVDADASKARLVIKNLESGEVKLEWEFRQGNEAEAKKGLLKVKAALASFSITNNKYVTEITAAKGTVKQLKDEVKTLESTIPAKLAGSQGRADFVKRLAATRDALVKAEQAGAKINSAHQSWYLNGPRKGVAPLLANAGIDEKGLPKAEADDLSRKLHEMSAAANEVKGTFDADIKTAVSALLTRLANIEAQATKSDVGAVAEVRKNIAAEASKVKELVGKALAETKVDKTNSLSADLDDPNSSAYKRLQANPKFIATEMESNKTRLAIIPKYVDMIEKQCVRIAKGVPSAFIGDGEIVKVLKVLDVLDKQNKQALAGAKTAIEACDRKLVQFKQTIGA